MRFKTTFLKDTAHSDIVSCVGWERSDEIYSASYDLCIKKINILHNESKTFFTLPKDAYPTGMHWCPKVNTSKKSNSELFALTATDGKFYFINVNGRLEKTVEGHAGAVICGQWSHDGNDFVTGGEDGLIKVWSHSGMLRNTLAQNSVSVYSVVWSSNNDHVLFTNGRQVVIKSLQASIKPVIWKAHESLILVVDWNPTNNLILTGAEDCKYRIWDSYGRALYSSSAHDYPITSVAWTPDGQLFAVGSFNTLRLCDIAGWSYALEKPNTGSVFHLAWSRDGTQVAGACGNGQVILSNIIERKLEWKNYEVTLKESQMMQSHDVSNNSFEKLDFRDRVIKFSLSFNYLVVVTAMQCYIYSVKNWNTPIIFDLKEGNVTFILQADKHFALVDGSSLYIYSYDGRLVSAPKYPALRADTLNSQTLSLSNDTIAIRDKTDESLIYLFDALTGKASTDAKITHKMEILSIAIDQCGPSTDRRLALIDKNHDLYLTSVRTFGNDRQMIKLGPMVESLAWNDAANMLAALVDGKFTVWYFPNVVYVDRDLLSKTLYCKDGSEFGKKPQLKGFVGNHLIIRRAEGALVSTSISPHPAVLHEYCLSNRWTDAVRFCRFAKDETLWSCLAAMAAYSKELSTAEVAYAAILEAEKVQYILNVKDIPVKEAQMAEMSLFCGDRQNAEALLLQSGLIFRAILLNIQLYNWERALDLAIKHKTHVDTVLAYRLKYLEKFERRETNNRFLQYSQEITINWDDIKAKMEMEYQRERERPVVTQIAPNAAPRKRQIRNQFNS